MPYFDEEDFEFYNALDRLPPPVPQGPGPGGDALSAVFEDPYVQEPWRGIGRRMEENVPEDAPWSGSVLGRAGSTFGKWASGRLPQAPSEIPSIKFGRRPPDQPRSPQASRRISVKSVGGSGSKGPQTRNQPWTEYGLPESEDAIRKGMAQAKRKDAKDYRIYQKRMKEIKRKERENFRKREAYLKKLRKYEQALRKRLRKLLSKPIRNEWGDILGEGPF